MIGTTLGKYEITGRIGQGGMGVVYTAKHSLIGRKAAVKLLLPDYSKNKDIVDRFFNEARAAAMVKHSGIVDIFDFGYADDGSAYIVMEHLDGESLGDRLHRVGTMNVADTCRLLRQSASALQAAHDAGIIHRDLKPDNIFITPDSEVAGGERVKVLDFGIAKLTGDAHQSTSKTATGTLMGSPQYMSPEQCRGQSDLDARADVYSLGCVAYAMLCGEPPFPEGAMGAIIAQHIYEPARAPSTLVPSLPEAVDDLVLTCLAKKPADRYASMSELITALRAIAGGRLDSVPGRTIEPTVPASRGRGVSPPDKQTVPAKPRAASAPVPETVPAKPGRKVETTTLRSAAGEVPASPTVEEASTRRGWLVPAAAVAVLAVGGVGYAVFGGGGGDGGAAPQPARPAAAQPTPTTVPAAATAASADAAPVPEMVTIAIDSVPKALVFDPDGKPLGSTPYSTRVEKSPDPIEYVLEKAGYDAKTVSIVPDGDRVESVVLDEPKRTRATKKKKRPPREKKKDDDPYDPFD